MKSFDVKSIVEIEKLESFLIKNYPGKICFVYIDGN